MDEIGTEVPTPTRVRLADRVGIVPRLVIFSLLSILVSVASVQIWTLRSVETNGLQRTQESLVVSMAMLKHELAPLGDTWAITPDGHLALGSTTLNDQTNLVDAVKGVTGAAVTIFQGDTRIATNVRNPDGSRGVGTKLAVGAARDAVLRDGHSYSGTATVLGTPYLASYVPIRDAQARTIGILFTGVPLAEAAAFMGLIVKEAIVGALAISLFVGLGYFWVLRLTIRPMTDLAGIMQRIADGVLECTVSYVQRSDQIGEMARALLLLRDTSARARALEQETTASRASAEAEKRTALTSMADKIEIETGSALEQIHRRTTAMTMTADAMSASAGRTGAAAESAASAAGQAMANAQSVAGAAEQLTASIHEIGRQMSQSAAVVGRAVAAGSETRATIEALNQQVEKIGAVADMIGDIAARTNLLALNATIEAARAGDAGKGFAVVASEVKALATQTARSTQQIAHHISQVRMATGASVAAVMRIEQTITEVNAIASSIAAAVEQQGAATAEIARNVTETAAAANEMTIRTTEVSAEAGETGRQASEVRENAAGLGNAMEELRHSVIRVVRTSTTEVDRRSEYRYPTDRVCRLSIAGHSSTAHLADLSEHGALVRGTASVPVGTRGTLTIDGVDFSLPFLVRVSEDDGLHLVFELDEATAARFRPLPERLAVRRAA
jgi:methyl-accepting chemotaxis protein